jgi:alpha-tubulin suppressor-like RCC1 family protein
LFTDTLTVIDTGNFAFPFTETAPDWVHTSGMMDVSAAGETMCEVTVEGLAQCDQSTTIGASILGPMPVGTSRVFAGNNQACALRGDGQVWCWGLNSYGQLGVPVSTATGATNIISPQLAPGLVGVTTMALSRGTVAASGHACATVYGGESVMCSGANYAGQLGTGTGVSTSSFTQVLGLTNVVELTAGNVHTCARTYSGGVYCWGDNTTGELGDGTNDDRFTPVAVAPW